MTSAERVDALTQAIDWLAMADPDDLADHHETLMFANAVLLEVYKRAWEAKMLRDHPYKREA